MNTPTTISPDLKKQRLKQIKQTEKLLAQCGFRRAAQPGVWLHDDVDLTVDLRRLNSYDEDNPTPQNLSDLVADIYLRGIGAGRAELRAQIRKLFNL